MYVDDTEVIALTLSLTVKMRNGVILLLIVAVLLTTASAFGAGNMYVD